MKKWASAAALIAILVLGVAAPAAAYSQRDTYPGGSSTWKDRSCQGYGSSETDFVQTIQLSGANTCDYIQVRANYKNGSWVGYSNWKVGTGYMQYVPPGAKSVVNFGEHGIDAHR